MTASDLYRLIENLIGIGTIAQVDADHTRVRVAIGDRPAGNWIRVPARISHDARGFSPLRVGTQVVVGCPGGDPAQAVILNLLYSDALPPPEASPTVTVHRWDDGSMVRYDSAARIMTVASANALTVEAAASISITSAGPVTLSAPQVSMVASQGGAGAAELTGSFRLRGDLEVFGTVLVNGSQHVTGSLTCDGINSNHHSHPGS